MLAQDHTDKADQHEAAAADMRAGKKDMTRLANNAYKHNDKMTHPDYVAAQTAKDGADQSRRNAEQSQEHAEAVVKLLRASAKRKEAAKVAGKAGDAETQKKLKGVVEHTAFQAAQHSPSNPNKPDVEKSEKLAKDSKKEAKKVLKAKK